MRTWDRLSATFVRGLKRPGDYGDGGGLMLQATANKAGDVSKSWLFRFQLDHRQRYMGLGSARIISLGEARELAHEARRLLARGIDPLVHRNTERAKARAAALHSATFAECLDGFLNSHADKWRGDKQLKQWQTSMATYAKPLMGIDVADVDVGMVLRVVEPIWKTTPVTADRVRSRIGEVLAWAQTRGLRPPGPLPTEWKNHLDKVLSHPRAIAPVVHHAAMTFDAVPGLYAKLIASDAVAERCLALVILTAVRSQEARGARWDEIDFAAGVWTIPSSRMKRSREHRVPLSKEALELIGRLPRNGEYLFSITGTTPVAALTLRKALHRSGGDGVTVHGFRSSFRDWGSERTNAPRELLEVALAHAIGNATEASYARGDLLEKRRRIMAQWATHCSSPPARDGAKVVALRG